MKLAPTKPSAWKGVVKKEKAISDCSDTAFGSLPVEKAVEEVAFADQSKDGWGFWKSSEGRMKAKQQKVPKE